MKKTLLRYGLSLLAAAILVILYLWLNSYSSAMEPIERCKCLANAFTVAGVLLLGVGSLAWISTTGFFDGIGYAFRHLAKMLIPGYFKGEGDYGDYKTEMADKRKDTPVLHVLLTGALCMAITAYYVYKFYQLYQG